MHGINRIEQVLHLPAALPIVKMDRYQCERRRGLVGKCADHRGIADPLLHIPDIVKQDDEQNALPVVVHIQYLTRGRRKHNDHQPHQRKSHPALLPQPVQRDQRTQPDAEREIHVLSPRIKNFPKDRHVERDL